MNGDHLEGMGAKDPKPVLGPDLSDTAVIPGVVAFLKEETVQQKGSDYEEQKQKDADGRNTRRGLGSHNRRGRRNAKPGSGQQCQRLPGGP